MIGMARFSVGGEADEGSSSQFRKKPRFESRPLSPLHEPEEEELHDEESSEEVESSSEEEEEEVGEEEGEEEEEEEEEEEDLTPFSEQVSSNGPPSNRNDRVITLIDPEVLDCPICFDSLTIPVFQCENGHIACISCCKKIAHKCPSCLLPIGYNRCRAIEKVLESVKLPCQNLGYGCKEMVNFSKKLDHEKICNFAPYSCPVSTCKFVGSCKNLYQHVRNKHRGLAVNFCFNENTPIFFTLNDKSLILQEEKGVLFILNNREESIGNVITVDAFTPPSYKDGYFYEVTAKTEKSNLRFQSCAKNIRKFDNSDSQPEEFLLVPRSLFGSYGQISLDLNVSDNGRQLDRALPHAVTTPRLVSRPRPPPRLV